MLAFSVKNKKINHQRTDDAETHTHIDDASITSKRKQKKTRRDHDGTMAQGYKNKLPAKLVRWFDREDYEPQDGEVSHLACYARTNESSSYGKSENRTTTKK